VLKSLSAAAAMTAWFAVVADAQPHSARRFVGRVVAEWLVEDGPDRHMRLLEPFALVDADGKEWRVPEGSRIDGASIPRVLWTSAGSPFTGDYRRASVIHDYYCDVKTSPWQVVHRLFYDGMLADGVSPGPAKTYYAAVRFGGPRWELKRVVGLENEVLEVMTTSFKPLSQEQFEQLESWVKQSDPSLDAIDIRVEAERKAPQ
jgi:hypothetical protein